ncbi:cytidine deaminase [Lingula anatina]|uniref:Cytidine deaminase n=1 Tax=Lingula anatina TaxID=7574 RepID=A0A1S3JJC2_LINAN|nr:cytidine deaminase [Lingula anatina]|eukprot:XP_013410226.1 cytidine deaminase [Lingula anatina]
MDEIHSKNGKTQEIQKLIKLSHVAKDRTHSPYSQFRVGAALLCSDGTVFTGCNVENASYGLTICAERTAVVKAVSEGHRDYTAIAISSDLKNNFIVPCGACRQVLAEFGTHIEVYMTRPDLTYHKMTVGELLPLCFTPDQLTREKIAVVSGQNPEGSTVSEIPKLIKSNGLEAEELLSGEQ